MTGRVTGDAVDAKAVRFAQFVEGRERALQRTAWLLTGDWALAEDLVQTALAKSWPRSEQIRRRDDPKLYVRRVMVNTWANWSCWQWSDVEEWLGAQERGGQGAVRIANGHTHLDRGNPG